MYDDDILNKELWVAIYKEVDKDEPFENSCFGVLASCFFLTEGDAWNAIENDVEQYKIGREDSIVEVDRKHNRVTLFEKSGNGMVWEIQKLKNF